MNFPKSVPYSSKLQGVGSPAVGGSRQQAARGFGREGGSSNRARQIKYNRTCLFRDYGCNVVQLMTKL